MPSIYEHDRQLGTLEMDATASEHFIDELRAQNRDLRKKVRELDAMVAVLLELLSDSGAIDRHVVDLRVEARLSEED